jgi:hypothetical protein
MCTSCGGHYRGPACDSCKSPSPQRRRRGRSETSTPVPPPHALSEMLDRLTRLETRVDNLAANHVDNPVAKTASRKIYRQKNELTLGQGVSLRIGSDSPILHGVVAAIPPDRRGLYEIRLHDGVIHRTRSRLITPTTPSTPTATKPNQKTGNTTDAVPSRQTLATDPPCVGETVYYVDSTKQKRPLLIAAVSVLGVSADAKSWVPLSSVSRT